MGLIVCAVEPVPVAPGDPAVAALAPVDYADAFRLRLPDGVPADLDTLARACLTATPRWVSGLLRLRNALMRPFGLCTDLAPDALAAHGRIKPGDSLGIFHVYSRTAHALLLGGDDRHLDFRVTFEAPPAERAVTLTTAVRCHHAGGRAYFAVVRPFHRLVVPALLRGGLRRLETELPPR